MFSSVFLFYYYILYYIVCDSAICRPQFPNIIFVSIPSFSGNTCNTFQESFSQISFNTTTLRSIHSELFGSCLEMVKRLFERSHEFETATPGLMMFSPSNLKKSPFVNLGDFIFTAQRQWIPTTCENATKV